MSNKAHSRFCSAGTTHTAMRVGPKVLGEALAKRNDENAPAIFVTALGEGALDAGSNEEQVRNITLVYCPEWIALYKF